MQVWRCYFHLEPCPVPHEEGPTAQTEGHGQVQPWVPGRYRQSWGPRRSSAQWGRASTPWSESIPGTQGWSSGPFSAHPARSSIRSRVSAPLGSGVQGCRVSPGGLAGEEPPAPAHRGAQAGDVQTRVAAPGPGFGAKGRFPTRSSGILGGSWPEADLAAPRWGRPHHPLRWLLETPLLQPRGPAFLHVTVEGSLCRESVPRWQLSCARSKRLVDRGPQDGVCVDVSSRQVVRTEPRQPAGPGRLRVTAGTSVTLCALKGLRMRTEAEATTPPRAGASQRHASQHEAPPPFEACWVFPSLPLF